MNKALFLGPAVWFRTSGTLLYASDVFLCVDAVGDNNIVQVSCAVGDPTTGQDIILVDSKLTSRKGERKLQKTNRRVSILDSNGATLLSVELLRLEEIRRSLPGFDRAREHVEIRKAIDELKWFRVLGDFLVGPHHILATMSELTLDGVSLLTSEDLSNQGFGRHLALERGKFSPCK